MVARSRNGRSSGQVLKMSRFRPSKQLATALHGNLNGKWINIPGPGHSADDRSLGVLPEPNAPDGFWVHSLAGDDPSLCRTYVTELLKKPIVGDPLTITRHADTCDTANVKARKGAALAIWNEAAPAQGTIVEEYLAARGCNLTADIVAADALRFHSLCPFGADRVPAMVALMRNVITGKPQGIHRTALKDDGSAKREMPIGVQPKSMLGPAKGAAVMLQSALPRLGIAEGIETALSAMQMFKTPVWATLSSGSMAIFPVLPGIKRLTVFADHDRPGMAAAVTCCRRYSAAGIDAEIRYPVQPETDWNDFLRGDKCQ